MQRNSRTHGGRASLTDVPAYAQSSFSRSLAQGGDFSHLLYDEEVHDINDRGGDIRPTHLPQHSSPRRNSVENYSRDNNRRSFVQNSRVGGRTEAHTRQNTYSPQRNPPLADNAFRRNSVQNPTYRSDHPSQFGSNYSQRFDRRSSHHNTTHPIQSVRIPNTESLKTHEGKAPTPISSIEPRLSKPQLRKNDTFIPEINPSRISLSKVDKLDFLKEKFYSCKSCGASMKVLKMSTLIRCNECGEVSHNNSSGQPIFKSGHE